MWTGQRSAPAPVRIPLLPAISEPGEHFARTAIAVLQPICLGLISLKRKCVYICEYHSALCIKITLGVGRPLNGECSASPALIIPVHLRGRDDRSEQTSAITALQSLFADVCHNSVPSSCSLSTSTPYTLHLRVHSRVRICCFPFVRRVQTTDFFCIYSISCSEAKVRRDGRKRIRMWTGIQLCQKLMLHVVSANRLD